jgi:hypothetical protein
VPGVSLLERRLARWQALLVLLVNNEPQELPGSTLGQPAAQPDAGLHGAPSGWPGRRRLAADRWPDRAQGKGGSRPPRKDANSHLAGGTGLLTSTDAPWLLSAVTQAAAAILALGVGSLSVASIFLFRAGQFRSNAATPFRRSLPRLGLALGAAGVCALLALILGSLGLFLLPTAPPLVLTILCATAAAFLVASAASALLTVYLLWQTLREVSG